MRRLFSSRSRRSHLPARHSVAGLFALATVASASGAAIAQIAASAQAGQAAVAPGGGEKPVSELFASMLNEQSLSFLSRVAGLVEFSAGRSPDFTLRATQQRVVEFLLARNVLQAGGQQQVTEAEVDNLVTSLATDLAYVSRGPSSDEVRQQREQYLRLVQIAANELEKLFGEYPVDQATEDQARAVFELNVQTCLNFFELPRLAAIAEPRLSNEMATLQVDVATAAQTSGRDFLERQFESVLASPDVTDEVRKRARAISMRSAASYLGSMPFQIYVTYGTSLGRANTNADLGRIASIGGITAEQVQVDGKPLLIVSYFFNEEEVTALMADFEAAKRSD